MINRLSILFVLLIIIHSGYGQENLLIGKAWQYKRVAITYQQDTLVVYHADSAKNVMFLSKVSLTFKNDNLYTGINTEGISKSGLWSIPNSQTIIVDRDTNQIVSLTGNAMRLKSTMIYQDNKNTTNGILLTDLYAAPVLCQSLQSGNWNDPSVWSCGFIPSAITNVIIQTGHTLLLDSTMPEAFCQNLEILGSFSMQGSAITVNGNKIIVDQTNVISK